MLVYVFSERSLISVGVLVTQGLNEIGVFFERGLNRVGILVERGLNGVGVFIERTGSFLNEGATPAWARVCGRSPAVPSRKVAPQK